MSLPLSLTDTLWIFLAYAFLGWCVEVTFEACLHGKFINRGFLNGPVCPIYGFGMLVVVLLLTPLRENLAALFFGSVLLTSALEFVTGLALEKLFHDKWWDYSREPFNLKGYICLRFSLLWGLACVFVMKLIHPLIMGAIHVIPAALGTALLCAAYATLIADTVLTLVATVKLVKKLEAVQILSAKLRAVADDIGEPLADNAIAAKGRFEKRRAHAEELHAKLKAYSLNRSAIERRILAAFPRLERGAYKDAFEQLRAHLAEHTPPQKQPEKHD